MNSNNFIKDLKNTSYYKDLILNPKVIMIYLGGSYCNGMASLNSDYDLTVIVDDSKAVDVSKSIYLTYKGKKVHWYYFPIKDFITCSLKEIWLLGTIYFRNFTNDLIIYTNNSYLSLISDLVSVKNKISTFAIYKLFATKKFEIKSILNQINNFDIKTFSKTIYHFCLCACYLTNTTLDKNILLNIKENYYNLDNKLQQIVVEYLTLGLNYIDKFPVDYRKELNELYDNISK